MRFTLGEIVAFCYENKRTRGFSDHTYDNIAEHIIWASKHDKLHVVGDDQGICGVCTASTNEGRRAIYIHHIVAVRGGFRTFIYEALKRWPDYSIQGLRSSKLVTFNKRHLLWAMK